MSTRTTPFEQDIGSRVSETASQVKEKVTDLGRTAADKFEASRAAAASKIDQATSDAKSIMTDVQGTIRQHPAPLILAAGVAGFLIGRSLTKRDYRRKRAMQKATAALVTAAAVNFKELAGVLFPRIRDLSQKAAQKAARAV